MDFDSINPMALLLGLVAFGISVFVSKSMGSPVMLRIIYGIISAVGGYLVASWIGNSG